ncbi:bifunctional riboflavin kinase/FAD synthetase [uncultured Bacteroides sp.]|uniref:bifunctional riboflavin kinase/FAD synthetase n=1 Tax=uncultured Bacteroides sp. TaxID=162156 RepID=UPI002AA70D9E|nr:bifunctional riboflavin kinase/FAD synthetase [uncultured Bacteroides sp.]
MQIIHNIPDVLPEPCVATIGFFDGVHIGHRFLIEQVKNVASINGLKSALITFPIHPRKVMNSDYRPELLTTNSEKIVLLEGTGVDYCMMLDFTTDISQLTACEFMKNILKERYNVQSLVIGYDHRFGRNRSEGFDDYSLYGKQMGMEVVLAEACSFEQTNVSSSVIRTSLQQGRVDEVARCLGYDYSIEGVVVNGYKMGRKIGFPTANLQIETPEKLIPLDGVYAVRVDVEGKPYIGMLNIGYRPTMDNGRSRTIEVHILHFNSDIYDRTIRLSFVQRIRSEMKFSGLDDLVAQLHKDAIMVESILG